MTHPDLKTLASRIHAALPQTQCMRCGFPDCASYAEAIAQSQAPINQCPPGGFEGVVRLAAITGQLALPLNPANGLEGPRSVAVIDEAWCIGCTLCLPVCPSDAIVGGNKMMHTVIESACTGCELCVAVCPVDCIGLENVTGERTGWNAWSQQEADAARSRYEFHANSHLHLAAGDTTPAEPLCEDMSLVNADGQHQLADKKRAVIDAALAKARASRTANGPHAPSPVVEKPKSGPSALE